MSSAPAAAILSRTINATRLIYFLYQAIELALSPAAALYLLYRGIREPRYFAGLRERIGILPKSLKTTGAGSIWFHAVSVGEVLGAAELIRALRKERPRVPIYVSTTTLTGRVTAEQKLNGLANGVFFVPLDYRSMVRRVLRRLRPALVVVLETEIWPNLYRESKRAGASLLIVNGRISDRALPSYQRWRAFFKHVLQWPDAILAQSEEDGRRFIAAGAMPEKIRVSGNVKYDFTPPAAGVVPEIAEFLDRTKPQRVWIAASTMAPTTAEDVDEDDAVIAAFVRLKVGSLLLILAPRKPERFDTAAQKLEDAGIRFVRRSGGLADAVLELPGVLLLDSIGELGATFERADVVFMGGTLARRGGHNILEPAVFGKPTIVGPHMENFAAIAQEFREGGAVVGIESPSELGDAVARLLAADPGQIGAKARALALSKRGVAARIAGEIWRAYAEGVPAPPRGLIARVLLTPCAWLWSAGHSMKSARALRSRRKLKTPVISIGGLSMGGAGKSPMVAHLARRLRTMGRDPAILTRGYKRQETGQDVIVRRGEPAAISVTGDEAQIFIRAGDAHVGIGADRLTVGRRMEEQVAPDIFLLDDGFQHVQLDRQHDVVLIDGLDATGGGVFPLGRLREPLQGLARANTIVITRVEPDQDIAGIKRLIARYNAQAPVFSSRVVALEWVEAETGTIRDVSMMKSGRVGAFCGLGEPRSFWRTLEELGMEAAFRCEFGDHHRYNPAEVKRLGEQAEAAGVQELVTTEKDAINLCAGAASLLAPARLYWLRIGIEIEKEEDFLQRIL